MVLTLAATWNWSVRQLDLSNAFLNGRLSEALFMPQPEGYVDPLRPCHVCRLKKALYGLKQAPRAWYDKLRLSLTNWGFRQATNDPSLFYCRTVNGVVILLIYVDDILVTGSNAHLISRLIQHLHQ